MWPIWQQYKLTENGLVDILKTTFGSAAYVSPDRQANSMRLLEISTCSAISIGIMNVVE